MPACAAIGCTASVKPEYLMCRRHWRMVPIPLQRAVWRAWRALRTPPKGVPPGWSAIARSISSHTYEAARKAAVDAVYRIEAGAP